MKKIRKGKNLGFIYDTKQIVLPRKGKVTAETMSMIFQIILYSGIFVGIDFLISELLKLLY